MTKNIKWRLSKLPSVDELQALVKDKIITQEEARSILFNEVEENERDNDSLKDEIKFLRELVERLSTRSTIIETIKQVQLPYYQYNWYKPYDVWCNNSTITQVGTSGTVSLTSGTTNVAYLSGTESNYAQDFTDLQTF